jgi:peptidoglycan/xylan/chitin deacetylase (PgdA/CDA1 family)
VTAAALAAEAPSSRIVRHGGRDLPRIALTFDVCPTRAPVELDERIVDELVTAHAKATFFVSGRWAKAKPDVVRHLAAEPLFEIGNHTFRHPHLIRADDAHVREELASTQELLRSLTGRTPTTWRPPFGEVDDRIARIAAGIGLATIEYDVISGDPIPTATATSLVRAVLLHAKAGSIVVMHANHRRFPTAAAVPQIIAGLRARGMELVTVSELVGKSVPVDAAPVAPAPVEAAPETR